MRIMSRLTTGLIAGLLLLGGAGGCSTDKAGDAAISESGNKLAGLMPVVAGTSAAHHEDNLVLSWEPIVGAEAYVVTVADPDGVIWTWSGTETEVVFGTLPIFEGESSEAIHPDFVLELEFNQERDHQWFVVAFDPDGEFLAMSDTQELPSSA